MTAVHVAAPPRMERDGGRPRRLHTLTALRYFAAVAVVLVHVRFQFVGSHAMAVAAAYGYVGVSFFFVLSGFVLTWSYAGQPATRFWWGRIARIWPLQMVLMLVAFALLTPHERVPGPRGHVEDLLLLQAWDPRKTVFFGGNGVSWSLSCEMFFYLLFPAVILLVRRLRRRGLAVAAAIALAVMLAAPLAVGWPTPLTRGGLVSAHTYFWLFSVFPPSRFGEFFLGMLLARATALGLRLRRTAPAWPVAVGGLVALIYAVTRFDVDSGDPLARPLVRLAALPLFALLLLAATTGELRAGAGPLRTPPLVLLGEWSFALFLVHKPLFVVTSNWGWWSNPRGLAGLGAFLGFLAFATAVAAAVHYLIEKPVERALRRLPDRWRRDPRSGPPDAAGAP